MKKRLITKEEREQHCQKHSCADCPIGNVCMWNAARGVKFMGENE